VKQWCIPKPSAAFVAKMEDVLDVYQRPYDPRYPQVCIDELHKELRSTPRGKLSLQPGQPVREDYEYRRHGACNLFMIVEPLTGFRAVWPTQQRTQLDFAAVLRQVVDDLYPEAEKVVLVTDNLNTHTPACLYARYAPEEAHRIAAKLEWHYTPEHGSWLNMAEIELSVLHRQCLNQRLPDLDTVTTLVEAWEQQRNHQQVGVDWRFTTADARIKLKRLYPTAILKDSP
jgi:hypothetical protein